MNSADRKLRRLARRLPAASVDAVYVSALPNIRYLTGFTGSAGHLLVEPERSTLFVDGRYDVQAVAETAAAGAAVEIVVAVPPKKPFHDLIEALDARRISRLGFETQRLTHAAWAALAAGSRRRRLEPLDGWVEELRLVKSPDEIEAIRRSAALNDQAFADACAAARPSWTERRLAAEIDYRMARLGASGPSFDTIVASGAHGALPHAQPRRVRLEPRTLVVVDHGAILDGYVSDMTRMVALGTPPPEAMALYEAVREAQQAALEAVKAGVKAHTVDAKARAVLDRRGFGDAFRHSTGHGVGLEIHEGPRIGPGEELRLKAGMVITIEPGAYIDGLGGARVEDLVAVTPAGCDVLSQTPRNLLVL